MSKEPETTPIAITACGREFIFKVARIETLDIEDLAGGQSRARLKMLCDEVVVKGEHAEFMEDARALAAQYGLEIEDIKLKRI